MKSIHFSHLHVLIPDRYIQYDSPANQDNRPKIVTFVSVLRHNINRDVCKCITSQYKSGLFFGQCMHGAWLKLVNKGGMRSDVFPIVFVLVLIINVVTCRTTKKGNLNSLYNIYSFNTTCATRAPTSVGQNGILPIELPVWPDDANVIYKNENRTF